MRQGKTMLYPLLVACLIWAAGDSSAVRSQTAGTPAVTVFKGARLITGDGSAPIESSAFVVENGLFTRVGRRGELPVPAGAAHVDLTGKTVMPTMTDLHGHFGFQNVPEGTMSKATFTRENLIDHLERLAYHGVGVRGSRHRGPDRPIGPARRPHQLGRCAVALARGGHPERGAVSHRRRRDVLAGRGSAGTRFQSRRQLSGDRRRGGARRRR